MKNNPFASINPGWVILPGFAAVFLWMSANESNGFILPCLALSALIVVGALWGSSHEKAGWNNIADSVGLDYQGHQFSGIYAERKVTVPIDSTGDSTVLNTVIMELKQPTDAEFVMVLDKRLSQAAFESGQTVGKKHTIQKSNPPDFAKRVFATAHLQTILDDLRPSALKHLELKDSTLILNYPIIPQKKLINVLEVARGIAEAIERTPLSS
jgi:hypothetical protein